MVFQIDSEISGVTGGGGSRETASGGWHLVE